MNETEYIDATDLAKLRASEGVLRDYLGGNWPAVDEKVMAARRLLSEASEHLARHVKIKD